MRRWPMSPGVRPSTFFELPGRARRAACLLGMLSFTLGALGALPPPGSASPEPDPARTARLARQQEDRLLLEACRYLRLAREQVNRLSWIAEQTDRRLARLQQDEDRILATMEQN